MASALLIPLATLMVNCGLCQIVFPIKAGRRARCYGCCPPSNLSEIFGDLTQSSQFVETVAYYRQQLPELRVKKR